MLCQHIKGKISQILRTIVHLVFLLFYLRSMKDISMKDVSMKDVSMKDKFMKDISMTRCISI